ncbi:unnamed protein product, partial [Mesorhabditis belari]|uniref:N-acetyltransferase domain-containing protein n=1 Tax=Mesorhabditis belari TaxID=2138241 RepID=A0AAF3FF65_9BILA
MNWRFDLLSYFFGSAKKQQRRLEERMASASLAMSSSPTTSGEGFERPDLASKASGAILTHPSSTDVASIVNFLMDHFVTNEPILSSLNITNTRELNILLNDLVADSIGCSGTMVAQNNEHNELIGVCLCSRHNLLDQQLDRLCGYSFTDPGLSIAIEFLKYIFNRVDVAYHLEESNVSRPVFVVLVCVKPEYQLGGLGKRLMKESLESARASSDRCDSAFTICTSESGQALYAQTFRQVLSRVKYSDYRGEFRDPPIQPKNATSLHVLLANL